MSKRLFYVLLVEFRTLDEDLMGMRSRDNQAKMLSDRKADREGHGTDNVDDALFRLTIDSWFRGRGEPQLTRVSSGAGGNGERVRGILCGIEKCGGQL